MFILSACWFSEEAKKEGTFCKYLNSDHGSCCVTPRFQYLCKGDRREWPWKMAKSNHMYINVHQHIVCSQSFSEAIAWSGSFEICVKYVWMVGWREVNTLREYINSHSNNRIVIFIVGCFVHVCSYLCLPSLFEDVNNAHCHIFSHSCACREFTCERDSEARFLLHVTIRRMCSPNDILHKMWRMHVSVCLC